MSISTEQEVIAIVADKLGMKEQEITLASKFVDDLGTDSLDQVELMMAFEAKFGVTISDEEAVKLATIQDVVNHIKGHAVAK